MRKRRIPAYQRMYYLVRMSLDKANEMLYMPQDFAHFFILSRKRNTIYIRKGEDLREVIAPAVDQPGTLSECQLSWQTESKGTCDA